MRTRSWVTLVALLSCLLTPAVWADGIIPDGTTFTFGTGPDSGLDTLSYVVDTTGSGTSKINFNLFDATQYCNSCEVSISFLPAVQDTPWTFTVNPAGDPSTVTAVVTNGIIATGATFLDPLFTGNTFTLELDTTDLTLTGVAVAGGDSEGNTYPISLAPVPEPSSVILISTGITALITQFRKKTKAS